MPRNPAIVALRGRWSPAWDIGRVPFGPIAGHPGKLDDAISAFVENRERLRSSGHLTSSGLRDRLRSEAAEHVVPLIKKARADVAAGRAAMAARRAELTTGAIDRSGVVGAMIRREI